MFPKYFFALCVLFLFVVVVSISAEEVLTQDADESEARNPALAVAVRIIMQAVKWAAKHCATEAAQNCKQHWKHPKNLVKCAKEFLEANKGRCVTG